jgi:hypothetical protein
MHRALVFALVLGLLGGWSGEAEARYATIA